MHPRKFALIGGIVLLVTGLAALVPGLNMSPAESGAPPLELNTSYGIFLGLVAMNIVNKIALITFGALGIIASRHPTNSLPKSVRWSQTLAVVMGFAAVLGLFRETNTLYGYWPLFGANVAIYAVAAIAGAYFGWALPSRAHANNADLLAEDRAHRRAA